jgi:hypothetical protein
MAVTLKTIIAKLETLDKEEAAKNAVEQELSCIEKAYFRSMYKGVPKSDIEILDNACQELRNRAGRVHMQHNNILAKTLFQCFALYFSEIVSASCAQKESAEAALEVLKEFATIGGTAAGGYRLFDDIYPENSQIDEFMTELTMSELTMSELSSPLPLDFNNKPKFEDDTESEWKFQSGMGNTLEHTREEMNLKRVERY